MGGSDRKLRIALGQFNPTVGDINGNCAIALEALSDAEQQGADLLVLSELFVTGYPPEDLVLKPAFAEASRRAVEALAERIGEGRPGLVIGAVWPEDGKLY
ncbi:MAG: nitrilase-related carbon-nitrogen hydrolase, partial [Pseudomonadota bacterium]